MRTPKAKDKAWKVCFEIFECVNQDGLCQKTCRLEADSDVEAAKKPSSKVAPAPSDEYKPYTITLRPVMKRVVCQALQSRLPFMVVSCCDVRVSVANLFCSRLLVPGFRLPLQGFRYI